ncbi:MAG TPA: DUF2142 domain-containing protein, partial [Candidatus Saccharimonadales bacterium]|nr:DUF2142 domain-containing protein [Candidatus Saccharimonadales bacterium]
MTSHQVPNEVVPSGEATNPSSFEQPLRSAREMARGVAQRLTGAHRSAQRAGGAPADGRWLAVMFLVMATLAATVSIILTPPMQVPDAFVQFDRAVQISEGGFVGQVRGHVAGGYLPSGLRSFEQPLIGLPFHYERKFDRADFRTLARATWGRGSTFMAFGSTTEYPPFAYLPGAAAVGVTRLFSSRILVAYYALEVVNALVYIALLGWAILLFRGAGALLIAALGLLPMAIALAASPSTDGLIIGLTGVASGIAYRRAVDAGVGRRVPSGAAEPTGWGRWMRPPSGLEWIALAAFTVAALAKPPYLALILVIGAVELRRRDIRGYLLKVIPAGALAALVLGAWYLIGAKFQGAYGIVAGHKVVPAEQLRLVITHPSLLVNAIHLSLTTFGSYYLRGFIGILGWLDTSLPGWVYLGLVIGLGVLAVGHISAARFDWRIALCSFFAA